MKKKLTRIYGLNEGPFDDINKQLGSAQSVAGSGARRSQGNPQFKKAQDDLNASQSVAKREAIGNWESKSVEELFGELANLTDELPPDMKASALQVIMALQKKVAKGGGGDTPFSSSASSMSSRSVGGLKLQ